MIVTRQALGWNDSWAAASETAAVEPLAGNSPAVAVRVIRAHRGAFHVAGDGGAGWAELPGKTFFAARDKRDLPTVGDWVLVERWSEACEGRGAAIIRAIVPRRGLMVRRAAGLRTEPQPLAANVDVVAIVTSANLDASSRRLDRFIQLAETAAAEAILIVSKVDLDPDAASRLVEVARTAGLPMIATSAVAGVGIAELHARVANRTVALVGSSGVGKSTLLNALLGEQLQATAAIRAGDDRGKHTTTHRELFCLPGGGVLIDTPGLRELGLWQDPDADDEVAADGSPSSIGRVAAVAATCRFRDCRHEQEPGCEVVAAIARGVLQRAQVDNFRKLRDETAATTAKNLAASWRARPKKPTR